MRTEDDGSRDTLRARWLVRLRWGSVAGQLAIILVARFGFGAALPVGTLVALTAVMAATNGALEWRVRRGGAVPTAACGSMIAFDTLQLTGLLWLSGGASNPFSVFYLVEIMVAAVTLGSRWTWFLATLAVSCYASLFAGQGPVSGGGDHAMHGGGDDGAFSAHLRAMWVALTLAAALTAYFVTWLSSTIERRDMELAAARERSVRHERLAALSTLAAGAAHELGTPLGTVAVAARELQRALEGRQSSECAGLLDDIDLIRGELDRCRAILDRMTAESGETAGEMPARASVRAMLDEVVAELRPEDAARIDVVVSPGAPTHVVIPRRALATALQSLIRNALDASPPKGRIDLTASRPAGSRVLHLVVADRGHGMPPDVLARAGEPFFTTKSPGAGMGLGLFLARALAERLGGRLLLESGPGAGTKAGIELPEGVYDLP